MINHNIKVNPSATHIFAANAICKDIDIFKKDYIVLTYILKHCFSHICILWVSYCIFDCFFLFFFLFLVSYAISILYILLY
jgi:hypothetical protein